jgi:hypothetical protein
MFRLADDVQVHLHREVIDFRIGINGLAILVEQAMHLDPFGRAVFAFCNRRRDRIRLRPLRVLADDEAARGGSLCLAAWTAAGGGAATIG